MEIILEKQSCCKYQSSISELNKQMTTAMIKQGGISKLQGDQNYLDRGGKFYYDYHYRKMY